MFENQNSQFNNQGRPIEPRQFEEGSRRLQPAQIKEPEDIFAKTESLMKTTPTSPSALGKPREGTATGKRLVLTGIIILVVVLVAGAGWWIYGNLKLKVKSEKLEEGKERIEKEIKEPTIIESPVMKVDTDGDGLSDEEEGKLGTDLSKPDTDEDGLFDREEVKVWRTDPLNPDTDADGYKDGEEVKGGYNPKGEGKWKVVE